MRSDADFRDLPRQAGPRDSVHRQTPRVEMQERRSRVECDVAACGPVACARQPVCPWMEQRNPRGRALCCRLLEVIDPTKDLFASMLKGCPEHAFGPEGRPPSGSPATSE